MSTSNYNVFISWSGETSKKVAKLLHQWIPDVVPDAKPWMSSEDIAKGSAWGTEIKSSLQKCNIGILVLTTSNFKEPWVLFEAGALEKVGADTYRCVFLVDLSPPIAGPLGQFQATVPNKEDVKKLMLDIHGQLDSEHDAGRTERIFEKFWGDFEASFERILKSVGQETHNDSEDHQATQLDLIREVLSSIRTLEKRYSSIESSVAQLSGRKALGARYSRALPQMYVHESGSTDPKIILELNFNASDLESQEGIELEEFVRRAFQTVRQMLSGGSNSLTQSLGKGTAIFEIRKRNSESGTCTATVDLLPF